MANELRMASSITPVKEVDVTEGGNTYDKSAIDTNAQRSWGGRYDLPAYTDDDIARWSQQVIDVTSATALSDGTAFEGNPAVDDGTLPTSVLAIAVEYTAELGTVGQVVITIGSQVHAELSVGESVVIPVSGASGVGLAIANFKIHADAYSDGVNEATVNVLLSGI